MEALRAFSSDDPARRVLAAGLVFGAVAVSTQTIVHLMNSFAFDGRYDPLNPDVEGNAFTWASASATVAAAFASLLYAVVVPENRRLFGSLAALLAFFSLDDVTRLHEELGKHLQAELGLPESMGGRAFVVVYLPLLALCASSLLRIASYAEQPIRRTLLVGTVFLVSAVLLEPLGAAWNLSSIPDRVEVAAEEGLELGGWLLIATGLAALLFRRLTSGAPPLRWGP